MAVKLYPPVIEGILPAFIEGEAIKIPYTPNRAVAHTPENLNGFQLMIKTMSTNKLIGTINANYSGETQIIEFDYNDSNTKTTVQASDFKSGEYYKVQLAYVANAEDFSEITLQGKLHVWTNGMNFYYSKKNDNYVKKNPILNKSEFNRIIEKISEEKGDNSVLEDYSGEYRLYRSNDEVVGYFSTVGIIKCTTAPQVSIHNLDISKVNSDTIEFEGRYFNEDDNEKVVSYSFDIYDSKGKLFATSGTQIHNHYNDTNANETTNKFILEKEMAYGKIYKIQYKVVTTNGLEAVSKKYSIAKMSTIDLDTDITLNAVLNEENAYIDLYVIGRYSDSAQYQSSINGNFIISRASSKTNFSVWNEITRFNFNRNMIGKNTKIFRDYTIEHGCTYQYSIQQYNKYGFFTERWVNKGDIEGIANTTSIVTVKFEHIFLYDGERQLKIKYDPKVNSIKRNVLESKTDTIGSKYPYIFRNGNVDYKEFPIEGLISYMGDEEELFLTEKEMFVEQWLKWGEEATRIGTSNHLHNNISNFGSNRHTNLTDNNIAAERKFREEVLSFLTNGKIKILKSPTEGNLIVRLLNTSLTPNEQLGRMLYKFSTTAYEIDDYNYQTLLKNNFIKIKEPKNYNWRWRTINTPNLEYYLLYSGKQEELKDITYGDYISSLKIVDAIPGTRYYLTIRPKGRSNSDGEYSQTIIIGVTGEYHLDLGDTSVITSLKVVPSERSGLVSYRYNESAFDEFNLIKGIEKIDLEEINQFIGKRYISEELNNKSDYLVDYKYLKFEKRPEITLYVNTTEKYQEQIGENNIYTQNLLKKIIDTAIDCKYYIDPSCTKEFQGKFEPIYIYKILQRNNDRTPSFISEAALGITREKLLYYIDVSQVHKKYPKIDYYYKDLTGETEQNSIFYYNQEYYSSENQPFMGDWKPLFNQEYVGTENQKKKIAAIITQPDIGLSIKLPVDRQHLSDFSNEIEFNEKWQEMQLEYQNKISKISAQDIRTIRTLTAYADFQEDLYRKADYYYDVEFSKSELENIYKNSLEENNKKLIRVDRTKPRNNHSNYYYYQENVDFVGNPTGVTTKMDEEKIYYVKEDYMTICYDDKIFIDPKEYDNRVIVIRYLNDQLDYTVIDLNKDLSYSATNLEGILSLEMSWGVTSTLIYNLKKYEYAIMAEILKNTEEKLKNVKEKNKNSISLNYHNEYVEAYVAHINALLLAIEAYERYGQETVEGNSIAKESDKL